MKRGIGLKLIFLFALFLIISLNFASAVITIVRPISNAINGSIMFANVSYTNFTEFTDAVNATFYYNLSGNWTLLGNVSCIKQNGTGAASCSGNVTVPINTESVFSINATINNGTTIWGASSIATNVSLDNKAPSVTYVTVLNNGSYSGLVNLTILVVDGRALDSVYLNLSFANGTWSNFSKPSNAGGGYYNFSFPSTLLPDGYYNLTVLANDTLLGNINISQIQAIIDNTAPTGTLSCSPASTSQGQTVTCTCSPADGLSGINSSSYSPSYSADTNTVGNNIASNCSFYDLARNLGSAIAVYNVTALSSSNNNQQSSSTTSQTNTFSSITPGNTSVIKNLDSSIGVQEIDINVATEADSVSVNVVQYTDKPDNVSVAKSGVYQYFQVQTQNLLDKLSTANMEIRVKKTWFDLNSLTKDDVALFKYDDSSSQWNELTTTYSGEDTTNYYYNVTLSSFSFFAIAQKEAAPAANQNSGENNGAASNNLSNDLTWLWEVLIGVVVFAIIIVVFLLIRKKKKGY